MRLQLRAVVVVVVAVGFLVLELEEDALFVGEDRAALAHRAKRLAVTSQALLLLLFHIVCVHVACV